MVLVFIQLTGQRLVLFAKPLSRCAHGFRANARLDAPALKLKATPGNKESPEFVQIVHGPQGFCQGLAHVFPCAISERGTLNKVRGLALGPGKRAGQGVGVHVRWQFLAFSKNIRGFLQRVQAVNEIGVETVPSVLGKKARNKPLTLTAFNADM